MLSHFSGVRLFATQWTVARQAPLFMRFFRQKYWSGLPCPPSPGSSQTRDPNPLRYPALAGGFFTTSATWETLHCIIKYMGGKKKKKERMSRSFVYGSLRPHGLWPARLLCPGYSPSKNTGVGCQFLPQGIFPTQGSNLRLLHCRQIFYRLSHHVSNMRTEKCTSHK